MADREEKGSLLLEMVSSGLTDVVSVAEVDHLKNKLSVNRRSIVAQMSKTRKLPLFLRTVKGIQRTGLSEQV